jgi:hypothetical protein
MRHDPEMPRAAAEYEVKRINELRQRQPNYLEQEFGVADPDSLLALPMHVVGERWLQVHDERWLYRETLRMSNCAQLASDTLGPPLPPERVVGTIVDDSLAYVLYEPQGANRETDVMYRRPPSVLQLHRERGSWWVLVGANSSGALMGVSCNRVPNTRKP